jgi:Protein of unknown function (DUF2934)
MMQERIGDVEAAEVNLGGEEDVMSAAAVQQEKQSSKGAVTILDESTIRDRIALKAYELWESRGRSHGSDVENWLEAERLIIDEIVSTNREVRTIVGFRASRRPKTGGKRPTAIA